MCTKYVYNIHLYKLEFTVRIIYDDVFHNNMLEGIIIHY